MDDLIARIVAEGWNMRLDCYPSFNLYICILTDEGNDRTVRCESDSPEAAIIDAIREMERGRPR